jgi:hypothetical protein
MKMKIWYIIHQQILGKDQLILDLDESGKIIWGKQKIEWCEMVVKKWLFSLMIWPNGFLFLPINSYFSLASV